MRCDCGKCLRCYLEKVAPEELCAKVNQSGMVVTSREEQLNKSLEKKFLNREIALAWGDTSINAEKRRVEGKEDLLQTWISEFLSELHDRQHTVSLMWKVLEPFANRKEIQK